MSFRVPLNQRCPDMQSPDTLSPAFLTVWEFVVPESTRSRFEQVYGPAGAWAQLFLRDPAYLGTELLHDLQTPGRYLTLDRWASEAAYQAFRGRFCDAYAALDRECEALTERETRVGSFTTFP